MMVSSRLRLRRRDQESTRVYLIAPGRLRLSRRLNDVTAIYICERS
jgi:hypothetical protein